MDDTTVHVWGGGGGGGVVCVCVCVEGGGEEVEIRIYKISGGCICSDNTYSICTWANYV